LNDKEIFKVLNVTSGAVMRVILTAHMTTVMSLMVTLAEKRILAPEDVSAFAMRTADLLSHDLQNNQEGIAKEFNDALQFYVDELLKMSEQGIPGASSRSRT
jgi:hypothetical protein